MVTKKSQKKSKKTLKQGPIPPPKKPLTMRQKFKNWLVGDVSG